MPIFICDLLLVLFRLKQTRPFGRPEMKGSLSSKLAAWKEACATVEARIAGSFALRGVGLAITLPYLCWGSFAIE
jgi:hypothetical protein